MKAVRSTKDRKVRRENIVMLLAFILTMIYLLWRLFFTLPLKTHWLQMTFAVLLLIAEYMTSFTTFELFYRKFKSNKFVLDVPEVDHDLYPHVDVFIATHNEPLDILYKTANACTFMDYPDKSKVHIYFSDDGNRESVHQLADELGIGYIGLAGNKHAKSGNLNNALSKTNSPLIATFDADMIPQRAFLMETVPYFFLPEYILDNGKWRKRTEEDEQVKIGLIQTPQSFYNPDLFQFNLYSEEFIPNEQDFFSREINIMRNSSNAIAYTGSNTLISRQAMEDIGGFPYYTITEDFETSIRIQQEHYVTYATSKVLAAGLTTTDFGSMMKQRKRWGQGVIQSLQNTNAIFSKKLSVAARITYLTSYLYWLSFFNRIIFLLAPILFALFDVQVVKCTFEQIAIVWLPSYMLYTLSFRFLSSNVRSSRWSQIVDTIFAPYLIIPIFLETFGIHEKKFKVTSKEHKQKNDLIYAIPHIILIILSVAAIIRFLHGKYGIALVYSSIIIFWLFYNLVSLSYAVVFMLGRKAQRKFERIKAHERVLILSNNEEYVGLTHDLSDEGMMIIFEEDVKFDKGDVMKINIQSEVYESHLIGTVVYGSRKEKKMRYAFRVEPCTEKDKRQYMQFIYDRPHSLPEQVDQWSTLFDDIKRNLYGRLAIARVQQRQHGRVDVRNAVRFQDGSTGYVNACNYQYLSISNFTPMSDANVFTIQLLNGKELIVERTGLKASKPGAFLFEIKNIVALIGEGVDFTSIVESLKKG